MLALRFVELAQAQVRPGAEELRGAPEPARPLRFHKGSANAATKRIHRPIRPQNRPRPATKQCWNRHRLRPRRLCPPHFQVERERQKWRSRCQTGCCPCRRVRFEPPPFQELCQQPARRQGRWPPRLARRLEQTRAMVRPLAAFEAVAGEREVPLEEPVRAQSRQGVGFDVLRAVQAERWVGFRLQTAGLVAAPFLLPPGPAAQAE